jgi:hypothetical protein
VRGKTSNEIAQIIGLIKRNVDFYIETACRKLKLGMCIQGPFGEAAPSIASESSSHGSRASGAYKCVILVLLQTKRDPAGYSR